MLVRQRSVSSSGRVALVRAPPSSITRNFEPPAIPQRSAATERLRGPRAGKIRGTWCRRPCPATPRPGECREGHVTPAGARPRSPPGHARPPAAPPRARRPNRRSPPGDPACARAPVTARRTGDPRPRRPELHPERRHRATGQHSPAPPTPPPQPISPTELATGRFFSDCSNHDTARRDGGSRGPGAMHYHGRGKISQHSSPLFTIRPKKSGLHSRARELRYYPDAHGKYVCGCPVCVPPGSIKSRKLRQALETSMNPERSSRGAG